MPRLTERYFRAPSSSADIAGSGLGPAIEQQAANKHGAVVEIDSNPGEATTFRVIFPTYRCLADVRVPDNVVRLADF